MGNVREIKEEEFDEVIAKGVVLVDFWATWCGPCRMLAPVFEQAAEELAGRATLVKANVEECKNLAAKFAVRNVPALLLFKDGELKSQMVGIQSKGKIADVVESALK